ncbi:ParE family toxin-like protein [Spirosoma areae]
MIHKTTPDYWDCYHTLPEDIQKLANKNYTLLKADLFHPSLHFKKVQKGLWSVRVGKKYRALATEDGEDMLWFWIGPHAEYDRLINQ